jgi:hypothetical protein
MRQVDVGGDAPTLLEATIEEEALGVLFCDLCRLDLRGLSANA